MKKQAVLSLSGGMDSSSLLLHLLANGYEVTALGFDYGQKHKVELERATSLVEYLNSNPDREYFLDPETLVKVYNKVTFQTIKLDGLSQLLNSALVTGGADVPEGHYEQDNMKDTVVPNRNKIFSSLVQAVALSVAQRTGETCDIALGIHAGDHAIYPDCRQEFRDADDEAFRLGNWGAEKVGYFTPYLEGDKFTILQDGEVLCQALGLKFDEVYSRTNTSYKPIKSENKWYSDFKSASSVERVEAFIKLGRPDPVEYAYVDDKGEVISVSWHYVVSAVEKVLNDYNK